MDRKATALRAVALTWTLFPWRERPGQAARARLLLGVSPRGFHPQHGRGAAVVSSHASPRALQQGNPSLSQLQSIAQDVFPYFLVIFFDVRRSARGRGMLGMGTRVLLIMAWNEIC